MSSEEREDKTIYKVVVNRDGLYSIWPADRENALGWNDAGKTGTKAECLAYIEKVWTERRPPRLREKIEELRQGMQTGQAAATEESEGSKESDDE